MPAVGFIAGVQSITSVMPAMKDITAQVMNAISAITGPLEGAISPRGQARSGRCAEESRRRIQAGVRGRRRLPWRSQERQLGAPVAMLNATCSFAVRQRSVAMDQWILDPLTAIETRIFLEKMRMKVGPTQISKQISRDYGKGQVSLRARSRPTAFDRHRIARSARAGPRWRFFVFLHRRRSESQK